MKISYALAVLLTVLATASAASSSSSSSVAEGQKSTVVVPSPQITSPVSSYPGPASVQYPAQSYQFAHEYNGPFAVKSAVGPRATAAAVPSPHAGPYQPYQQQQYNFGPYQHYFPASGYPLAAGAYPTAYSSQSAAAPYYYPTPYSAYPYAAQLPYHGASYSPYHPIAYQPYNNGQFIAATPYSGQYSSVPAAPSVTPYSAVPSPAYQPQEPQSSFHNTETANQFRQYGRFQEPQSSQQFPSQQQQQQQHYLHSQQYPSFYPNSPKTVNPVAADTAAKITAEKK